MFTGMARTDLQVNFRMPPDLKARLEEAAKGEGRSLTSEIIKRLEQTFQPFGIPPAHFDELMGASLRSLEEMGFLRKLQSESDEHLAEDVREIIEFIDDEIARKPEPHEPKFTTQLGRELADTIDRRTEFAINVIADNLVEAGLLDDTSARGAIESSQANVRKVG